MAVVCYRQAQAIEYDTVWNLQSPSIIVVVFVLKSLSIACDCRSIFHWAIVLLDKSWRRGAWSSCRYEAICNWTFTFGTIYAKRLRSKAARSGDHFYTDEVNLLINRTYAPRYGYTVDHEHKKIKSPSVHCRKLGVRTPYQYSIFYCHFFHQNQSTHTKAN